MPPHPISTLTTLVIPLFFVLGVVSAPPGTAVPAPPGTAVPAPPGAAVPLSTSAATAPTDAAWPPHGTEPLRTNAAISPTGTPWSPHGTEPDHAIGSNLAGSSLGFAERPGPGAVVDGRAEPSDMAEQRTATGSSGATTLDRTSSPAFAPSTEGALDAVRSPLNGGTHGPVGADGGIASHGTSEVGRGCSGSACEWRRPAPRAVEEEVGGNLPAGPAGAPVPAWCASLGPIALIPTPGSDCAAGGADPFERTPLDPEYCEYVGPAPFFMSPSDSESCGLVSPAPLSLPSVGAGRPAG